MSARLLPILLVAFAVYLIGHGDASAAGRRDASQLQLAERAQSDQATLDAMQRRLDQLVPLKSSSEPLLIYHLAKAQAWLDFAFDARAQRDNSGAASEALAEANRLMAQLEAQANDIALDTTIVPSSRKLRDDIWLKAEAMKRHQSFRCAASRIAQFEVELVQVGRADKALGWRHARPHMQKTERLVKEAEARLDACASSVTSAAQLPPEVAKQPPAVQVQSLAESVHFAYRLADISAPTARVLEQLAFVLRTNPVLTLELQGHADRRGSARVNLALSRQRAESVAEYLASAGVPQNRTTVVALGTAQPRANGSNAGDFARNRRVQFVVLPALEVQLTPQETDLQIESDPIERGSAKRNSKARK